MRKRFLLTTLCSLTLAAGSVMAADNASENMPEIASSESGEVVVKGWSAKDHILDKTVYNEKDDKVGDIRDIVFNDDREATHYIVGVGGFLGVAEHDVAIEADKLSLKDSSADKDDMKFVLTGYSKDELKELPKVKVE